MNPFEHKAKAVEDCIVDWKTLASKPYNKNTVDPYTKLRIILVNGAEFESTWFLHQFSRHCPDNELRRELCLLRRIEQQQQKRIASLKPINEGILETTIGYEMLAVDLTAALAKSEENSTVKKALDFALLEDYDHLYRYANLLEGEQGIKAEKLVGCHVEIMPGRPTISEHRFPFDDIKPHINSGDELLTKLNIGIIIAAEQQTMNYYMNIGSFYESDAGRRLYAEIAMIEEQHVSHYESLKDVSVTWLECLLMHEYTECYLYYSNLKSEKDTQIKPLWEELFNQELAHLHKAARLLEQYEKKEWQQVIPNGAFPELLQLEPSKEYVREVLKSVRLTANREDYIDIDKVPDDAEFFKYQNTVNSDTAGVQSHKTIKSYIGKNGEDYRYTQAPHPIEALDDRKHDNTEVGRKKK
ncbi:MAG: hypothetical protein RSA97_05160 [Oscillospiraceae bacterium]